MLSFWEQSLLGFILMAAAMSWLWYRQLRTRDAGVVDVAWAGGLGFMALFVALTADGDIARRVLLALVAGIWGFRLAAYLYFGRIRKGPEDGRYTELRRSWGDKADRNLFFFYQFQSVLVIVFALPYQAVAFSTVPGPRLIDWIGVVIGLITIGGESLADYQLARFRNDPENRGKICQTGLWRYSRHPNYFFEWLHWFAYVALAWGAAWWLLTLLAPALMLFLLFKVTGIPATEKRALASRGDAYRRYQRTTSRFIPWFPKEDAR